MSIVSKLIKQYSGQYNTVTFQRPYVEFTGSVDGALLLGQLIYWSDKGDEDGWFYKSYMDWENEIYVKERSARAIFQDFKSQGFLEILKRRTANGTPKMHYRFSIDQFAIAFEDFLKAQNPDGGGFGKNVGTKRQKCRNQTAKMSEPNSKNVGPVPADLPFHPYIQLITNQLTTYNQDPECAIEEVKTCQVEICLEPEPIEAFQPLALDQTGITHSVKRSKKSEDKCSATGAVALVSTAVAEKPVKADPPATVCVVMDDGGYERFRAEYTGLCVDVHRRFGKSEEVKKAWKAAWQGLEPPDRFWFGLDCYVEQQKAEYAKTGECWMVGAKRFLDADEVHWESAIRRHEVSQRTQSFGVDIDSPSSMKRANIVSSNQRNWAIAKQQLIAEGRAV